MNPLFADLPTTVFTRMSALAVRHGAVNLGQGFPDFGWPDPVIAEAQRALAEESNQYAPMTGLPRLREAVAAHYNRHHGLALDPAQVVVTSGATEAIAATIVALVMPGDEVIVMTPAYDAYAPLIRLAGGIVREVALSPPEWRVDAAALADAVGPRTRVLILNNPHNPTGRMFGADELAAVAEVACSHGLTVISDEVWEHVLLDGRAFTPIAALPGMAERTVKVGSAGKIFSLTGWKIGWLVAEAGMAATIARAHQFLTFASAPALQHAAAFGLEQGDLWLGPMRDRFQRGRDRLAAGLRAAGYAVQDSAATYFLCVDLAASGLALDDEAFAAMAVERAGVAVIPLSPFAEQDPPRSMIRLCFAKTDATLDKGIAAMARARDLALS